MPLTHEVVVRIKWADPGTMLCLTVVDGGWEQSLVSLQRGHHHKCSVISRNR